MKIFNRVIAILSVITLILGLTFSSSPFNDTKDHWANDNIVWAFESGFVNGYEDGSFRPDNNITKAEFYKMVNRLLDYHKSSVPNFSDVFDNDWFYDEVSTGVAVGYISNTGENLNPNDPISRDEAGRILSYIYDLQDNVAIGSKFSDSDSIVNLGSVGALASLNILDGFPDNTYRPNEPLTRGEVSKIFNSAFEVLGREKLNYSTPEGILTEPLDFNSETSSEDLRSVFDYIFSVYKSNKSFDNPTSTTSGFKSVKVTKETGEYLSRVIEDNEVFNDFLLKGGKGSFYRPINFPYNIAYSGIDKFYFKANYITPEEQLLLENEISNDILTLKESGRLTDDQSQREKLYVLFEFLANKASYVSDESLLSDEKLNSKGTIIYSPYAVVNGGDTVCQGYAGYFILLSKAIGIDVFYEEGTFTDRDGIVANHAWNSVIDDGVRYYIDPTGGDQSFGVYDKYFYMIEDELSYNGYEKRI